MEKNYANGKQMLNNQWNNTMQKKYLPSAVIEKKHIRNPKQFNSDKINPNYDQIQSEAYPHTIEVRKMYFEDRKHLTFL